MGGVSTPSAPGNVLIAAVDMLYAFAMSD